jgi:hypothetical protein
MPVLEDIIKCVITRNDISYLFSSNTIIHKFCKTLFLPINIQDGKAISFTFNQFDRHRKIPPRKIIAYPVGSQM